MVNFSKGTKALRKKKVEELSSLIKKNSLISALSESEMTQKMLDSMNTPFKGREDLFMESVSFMIDKMEDILTLNSLNFVNNVVLKNLVIDLLNLTLNGKVTDLEKIDFVDLAKRYDFTKTFNTTPNNFTRNQAVSNKRKDKQLRKKMVREVAPLSGQFYDMTNTSEYEIAKKLLDSMNTHFKGREDLFMEVMSFIRDKANTLNTLNSFNKDSLVKLLSGLLDFTITGQVTELEKIDFVDYAQRYDFTKPVNAPPHAFTINQTVSNSAGVNQNITNNTRSLLWYVVDNVDRNNADKVEITNDNSANSEEIDFNGKKVFLGDRSKIKFSDDGGNEANVSMANTPNTLNISHAKQLKVPSHAMTSSFKGVVDYMENNGEIPFEFTINTKTEDFKKNFISLVLYYVEQDKLNNMVSNNPNVNTVSNGQMLSRKITSFLINGMSISYDDFASFKTYDDFVAFEEKVNKAKKDEELRKQLLNNEIANTASK